MSVTIPPQLQDHGNFILLKDSASTASEQKTPAYAGWARGENILTALEVEIGNRTGYGVLTGHKGLLVADCDKQWVQDALASHPLFKDTFTVKSASKKLNHYYFRCDDGTATVKYNDKDNNKSRLLDLQGLGAYVVGPGSVIVNGSYDIVCDAPVKKISYAELISIITSLIGEPVNEKPKKNKTVDMIDENNQELDPILRYVKQRLTIRDILNEWGIDTKKGRNCMCPLGHGSVSGLCFSYEDHVFYCFHCLKSGTIVELVQEKNKSTFLEAREWLANKVGVPENVRKHAKAVAAEKLRHNLTEFIVNEFLKNNNVKTTINDNASEMWVYVDGIYLPHGRTHVKAFTAAVMREHYTSHIANAVIAKVETRTLIREEEFFTNIHPNLLPVQNGILNVFDLSVEPYDPNKIFFAKLSAAFDPERSCLKWVKFLESVVEKPEDVLTLQEFVGYCLYKENKYKKSLLLIGDGDNGKSVFLNVLTELLSPANVSHLNLATINGNGFERESLFGKLANINADIGKAQLEETEEFKKVATGDHIEIQRKFRSSLRCKPFSKLIFAANQVPGTDDKTDGFFTRWLPIVFPNTFRDGSEYELMTEEERIKNHVFKANRELESELKDCDELSGILNWALDGLKRLVKNKGFSGAGSVAQVKRTWYSKSESMVLFMAECLEHTGSDEDWITAADLSQAYNKWCAETKLKPQSPRAYNPLLESFGAFNSLKRGPYNDRLKVWQFIKIKVKR